MLKLNVNVQCPSTGFIRGQRQGLMTQANHGSHVQGKAYCLTGTAVLVCGVGEKGVYLTFNKIS